MRSPDFRRIINASSSDRRDLFLETAQRLGTPLQNVEKDFWVCWTLDALYNGLRAGGPRLLFKGGTSLSKAYGLIRRFSEDIDVTVFRDDLNQPASVDELEGLTGKKRKARLAAIRDACQTYVAGPLRDSLAILLSEALATSDRKDGRVDTDQDDPDGQTLLVWYPSIAATEGYVRPAVRIESGAKSALDPHRETTIKPYVAEDLPDLDLAVTGVTTIEPARTFWDKAVIAHGLRRRYERRGELRQEGHRISRHFYDLHCLAHSETGPAALRDGKLRADCVRHARMFFNRPDFDLASATPGSFALMPTPGMLDALRRDYQSMAAMIFGPVPAFDEVMTTIEDLDRRINHPEEDL